MSCFEHTMLVLAESVTSQDPLVSFACICHDLGKKVVFEKYGKLHGHEEAGVAVINSFCDRFRVPNEYRSVAIMAALYHSKIHNIRSLRATTIVDMFVNTGAIRDPSTFKRMLQVCYHDAMGRGGDRREYDNHLYTEFLLNGIISMDIKSISADAISKGMKGEQIGKYIRDKRVFHMKQLIQRKLDGTT